MPPSSGSNSYLLREPAGISTNTTHRRRPPRRRNIAVPRIRGLNLRALVLWDIDGTLVDSAKLGPRRLPRRVRARHRRAAGASSCRSRAAPTSRSRPTCWSSRASRADDGVLEAFEDALDRRDGRARRASCGAAAAPIPGARESLERLGREPGVVQGLLTGNIPANARGEAGRGRPRQARGLRDRRRTAPTIASAPSWSRSRCETRGAKARRPALTPRDAVLVGDTPLDVAAAQRGRRPGGRRGDRAVLGAGAGGGRRRGRAARPARHATRWSRPCWPADAPVQLPRRLTDH